MCFLAHNIKIIVTSIRYNLKTYGFLTMLLKLKKIETSDWNSTVERKKMEKNCEVWSFSKKNVVSDRELEFSVGNKSSKIPCSYFCTNYSVFKILSIYNQNMAYLCISEYLSK